MALKVVENGLTQFLLDWATKANTEEYEIGLFKNDWTPVVGDTISAVTPCDFGGYTGTIVLDSWDTGGLSFVDPRAVVLHPFVTWTADGTTTNNVYGYYVQTTGGVLLWAERRVDSPVPAVVGVVAGQTYSVIPKMTMRSEF